MGLDRCARQGRFCLFTRRQQGRLRSPTRDGRVALRSYGSISYAGLLSYIYADLQRDDPRVQAAFDWLRGNYTLDEIPAWVRKDSIIICTL